ncbi:MAG: hypothetical protein BBJ60_07865 [Desulfobacterales bacterium S7086C20]|nr:MAG: hypothetical protein BBJ60_07865 [Desulfobacterales bacterium S7086C20]
MLKKKPYGIDRVAHHFLSAYKTVDEGATTSCQLSGAGKTEPTFYRGDTGMLRIASEVITAKAPREDLIRAAGDFLLHSQGNPEVVHLERIVSSEFGSSDVAFTSKSRDCVTVARLNSEQDSEAFLVESLAYYLWAKELISVNGAIMNTSSEMKMFLFSSRFSKSVHRIMGHWDPALKVHLVKYRIFQVEDLGKPVVHFEPVTPICSEQPRADETSPQTSCVQPTADREDSIDRETSAEEYDEFVKLRSRYLK